MRRDLQRVSGFLGATLVLLLLLGALAHHFFVDIAGADTAIITHLKTLESEGLELRTPAGTLTGEQVHYQRIAVTLDAEGTRATMIATLDFTGEWRRGDVVTRVSSLGLERAHYVRRDGAWRPERTDAPRLLDIIAALDRRVADINAGAALPEIRDRKWESRAWFIRSERAEVEVAEDYRLTGWTLARPIDEKATRRLSLREDADGGFSFPGGLM